MILGLAQFQASGQGVLSNRSGQVPGAKVKAMSRSRSGGGTEPPPSDSLSPEECICYSHQGSHTRGSQVRPGHHSPSAAGWLTIPCLHHVEYSLGHCRCRVLPFLDSGQQSFIQGTSSRQEARPGGARPLEARLGTRLTVQNQAAQAQLSM